MYLPLPRSNELIISYVGRTREHCLLSRIEVVRILFGRKGPFSISSQLPKVTNHFCDLVERQIGLTTLQIISNHTAIPLYARFLTRRHVADCKDYVYSLKKSVDRSIGFAPKGINYCPICSNGDLQVIGETYWRMEHNLSSIQTCVIHKCRLKTIMYKDWLPEFTPNRTEYCLEPQFDVNQMILSVDQDLVEIWNGTKIFEYEKFKALAIQKHFIIEVNKRLYFNRIGKLKFVEHLRDAKVVAFNGPQIKFDRFFREWNLLDVRNYLLLSTFLEQSPALDFRGFYPLHQKKENKKETNPNQQIQPTKEEILKFRRDWIILIEANDFQTIKVTGKQNQEVYRFLLEHDKIWIKEINQKFKNRNWKNRRMILEIKTMIFYQEKDLKLLSELKVGRESIMNEIPEKQITPTELYRIGGLEVLSLSGKLPNSWNYIKENIESNDDFKLRRFVNYLRASETNVYEKSTLMMKFQFRSTKNLNNVLKVVKELFGLTVEFK